jgi:ABC-type taurine transport system ATPase subunit
MDAGEAWGNIGLVFLYGPSGLQASLVRQVAVFVQSQVVVQSIAGIQSGSAGSRRLCFRPWMGPAAHRQACLQQPLLLLNLSAVGGVDNAALQLRLTMLQALQSDLL